MKLKPSLISGPLNESSTWDPYEILEHLTCRVWMTSSSHLCQVRFRAVTSLLTAPGEQNTDNMRLFRRSLFVWLLLRGDGPVRQDHIIIQQALRCWSGLLLVSLQSSWLCSGKLHLCSARHSENMFPLQWGALDQLAAGSRAWCDFMSFFFSSVVN